MDQWKERKNKLSKMNQLVVIVYQQVVKYEWLERMRAVEKEKNINNCTSKVSMFWITDMILC